MFSVGELQNLIWTSLGSESVPRVTRRSKQKSVAKAWENKNWQHFGRRNPQTHRLLEKVSLFKIKTIWLSNILQRRIVPVRESTKHKCIHVYVYINIYTHFFSKLSKAQWKFQNRFFIYFFADTHLRPMLRQTNTAVAWRCWPGVIRVDGVKKLLQFFLVQRAVREEGLELIQRQLPVICRQTQKQTKETKCELFSRKKNKH